MNSLSINNGETSSSKVIISAFSIAGCCDGGETPSDGGMEAPVFQITEANQALVGPHALVVGGEEIHRTWLSKNAPNREQFTAYNGKYAESFFPLLNDNPAIAQIAERILEKDTAKIQAKVDALVASPQFAAFDAFVAELVTTCEKRATHNCVLPLAPAERELMRLASVFKTIQSMGPFTKEPLIEGVIPSGPFVEVFIETKDENGRTTKDKIIVYLYEQTPMTLHNFYFKANTGGYDTVTMHRIIPGFCIQGGDPTGTGAGGSSIYGGHFEDEIVPGLKNKKYTLAMANAGPGTNGSQFFFNMSDNSNHLDGKHTVFGIVLDDYSRMVLDKLQNVEVSQGRPIAPVTIYKMVTAAQKGRPQN